MIPSLEELKRFPQIDYQVPIDFTMSGLMYAIRDVSRKFDDDFLPAVIYCNETLKKENKKILYQLKRVFGICVITDNNMKDEEYKILFQAQKSSDNADLMITKNVVYWSKGI